MKKLAGIIAALMLLAGTSLYAEAPIAAGTLELGIGKVVSYDRIWNDDITLNKFAIGTFGNTYTGPGVFGMFAPTPVFGIAYFVTDGLALGAKAGYSYLKEKDEEDAMSTWFISPEVKFYVPISEGLLLDAHGSFGYTSVKNAFPGGYDQTGMNFELGIGLNVLITQQFAMVVGFDYTYTPDYEEEGEKVADSAMSRIGVSLGFKTFISMN